MSRNRHDPDTGAEFPRHGGFYIATWAEAYRRTEDPVFLKAIDTVLGYFEDRRPSANMDPYVVAKLITETVCEAAAS